MRYIESVKQPDAKSDVEVTLPKRGIANRQVRCGSDSPRIREEPFVGAVPLAIRRRGVAAIRPITLEVAVSVRRDRDVGNDSNNENGKGNLQFLGTERRRPLGCGKEKVLFQRRRFCTVSTWMRRSPSSQFRRSGSRQSKSTTLDTVLACAQPIMVSPASGASTSGLEQTNFERSTLTIESCGICLRKAMSHNRRRRRDSVGKGRTYSGGSEKSPQSALNKDKWR
jgi:hypothetical protein